MSEQDQNDPRAAQLNAAMTAAFPGIQQLATMIRQRMERDKVPMADEGIVTALFAVGCGIVKQRGGMTLEQMSATILPMAWESVTTIEQPVTPEKPRLVTT